MTTETEQERWQTNLEFLQKTRTTAVNAIEKGQLDVAAADRLIANHIANRPGQSPKADVAAEAEGPQESPYAGMGPQAAVEEFFRQSEPVAYKPSRIARILRHYGCRASAKSNVFVSQVRTACLRLTEKGILDQTELEGKTAFQIKEPAKDQAMTL